MAINSIKGRTFTGCWACRLKKRRCDERKPQCSLCEKHNDNCCYDVKLIWLDENIHKVAHGRYKTRAELLGNRNYRRASKEYLQSLVRGSELGDMETSSTSSSSSDDNKNDNCSFTVSVRRLKIYNNAVASVYGRGRNRNYSQRHVNHILDRMLNLLEKSHSCKEGPFMSFELNLDSNACGKSSLPTKKSTHLDQWIDQELTPVFWLQQQDPILSNDNFRQRYLNYIRRTVSIEFCQSVQGSYTPIFIRTYFPQWIPIALTIMVAIQGYTMELGLELEMWILERKHIELFMLPAISFAIMNSKSYQVLCHCKTLLSGCTKWQEARTLELQATEKLIDQRGDKIVQKLSKYQDTTLLCSQFKFWQAQLEKFHSIPI